VSKVCKEDLIGIIFQQGCLSNVLCALEADLDIKDSTFPPALVFLQFSRTLLKAVTAGFSALQLSLTILTLYCVSLGRYLDGSSVAVSSTAFVFSRASKSSLLNVGRKSRISMEMTSGKLRGYRSQASVIADSVALVV